MNAARPLLHLTLIVALAAVCPLRCHADAAETLGGGAEARSCPCCPGESSEAPGNPDSDSCTDCVGHGAVDGPKISAVELSAALPGDLPSESAADRSRLSASASAALEAQPAAPEGAALRVLLGSLLI